MGNSPDVELPARKLSKGVLSFVTHQFVGTLGIDLLAGYLTGFVFDVFRLLGKPQPSHRMYWILTGTPYYPVQIGLALTLGYAIGRRVRHRAMLWVWVLPLAYLTYALIAIPTLVPQWIPPQYQAGVGESRFKHYFGWGCGDSHPCFDQNAITVLFYIAAAYSIGALLARRSRQHLNPATRIQFWVLSALGVLFLVVAASELEWGLQGGWQWIYLSPIVVAAGIGGFLLFYAALVRAPTDNAADSS
jgi:hypothetical protein